MNAGCGVAHSLLEFRAPDTPDTLIVNDGDKDALMAHVDPLARLVGAA